MPIHYIKGFKMATIKIINPSLYNRKEPLMGDWVGVKYPLKLAERLVAKHGLRDALTIMRANYGYTIPEWEKYLMQ